MKKILLLFLLICPMVHAATWYVNATGGPRYDATANPTGTCDGTSAAAPVGTTPDQHCAFWDVRMLWANGSYVTDPSVGYPNWGWVGSSGDTYVIGSCIQYSAPAVPIANSSGPCRIGYSGQTGGGNDPYLAVAGNNGASGAPSPPSGTSGAHTTIIGAAFVGCGMSCPAGTTKSYINGGYGTGSVLSVAASQYVDIIGLDIDDHAQCGVAGNADGCDRGSPVFDDFADNGVSSDTGTSNVTLTDVNIHGLAEDGWHGPIGGNVTFERVYVGFNTNSGINLDNGSGIGSTGGMFTIDHSTIEFNGCIEQYPISNAVPAYQCFDQNSGGYGDAIGTPGNDGASFTVTNSLVRYNTQDGIDLLHSFGGTIFASQNQIYGNEGQSIKLGATSSSIVRTNLIVNNCYVMNAGFNFPGAPVGYNAGLTDTCRAAGDVFAVSWGNSSNVMEFDNNTVIAGGASLFDISCSVSDCSTGTKTLRNNIFIAYGVTEYNSGTPPGTFCYNSCNNTPTPTNDSMWTARSNNTYYNFRACPPLLTNENCNDPVLTTELPTGSSVANVDFQYSAFNFLLPVGSPSIRAGVNVPGLTTDYAGNAFANPPSIGAYEFEGATVPTVVFSGSMVLSGGVVIQ